MGRAQGISVAIAASVAVLLSAAPASAMAGDLDATFRGDGRQTYGFPFDPSDASAVAVDPEGRIVIGGDGGNSFGLCRLLSDGAHDPGFGSSGIVSTRFRGRAFLRDVALQTDGKILAVGGAQRANASVRTANKFALARYRPNGSLDPSFGGDGRVVTGFRPELPDGGGAFGNVVALQQDGDVVVAGFAFASRDPNFGAGTHPTFAVARYTPNGHLDQSFGNDGRLVLRFPGADSSIDGIALQEDGKIVAGGLMLPDGGSERFALARFDDDGSLDATFGNGGLVTGGGVAEAIRSIAIQPDGRIVVVRATRGLVGFSVARYDAHGYPDASFGGDGHVLTSFGGHGGTAASVQIQADGRIVVAGIADGEGGIAGVSRFGLARYLSDGSPDPEFGGDGTVVTRFDNRAGADDLEIAPRDGKIVVSGFAGKRVAVARYLPS